jgi:hypothetical protein
VEQSSAEVTLRVRAADAGPPFVVRAMPGAKLIFEWERSVRLAAPDSIDHIKSSRLLGFEREREKEREFMPLPPPTGQAPAARSTFIRSIVSSC